MASLMTQVSDFRLIFGWLMGVFRLFLAVFWVFFDWFVSYFDARSMPRTLRSRCRRTRRRSKPPEPTRPPAREPEPSQAVVPVRTQAIPTIMWFEGLSRLLKWWILHCKWWILHWKMMGFALKHDVRLQTGLTHHVGVMLQTVCRWATIRRMTASTRGKSVRLRSLRWTSRSSMSVRCRWTVGSIRRCRDGAFLGSFSTVFYCF